MIHNIIIIISLDHLFRSSNLEVNKFSAYNTHTQQRNFILGDAIQLGDATQHTIGDRYFRGSYLGGVFNREKNKFRNSKFD